MSYATVSEAPGHRVTRDAITMMYTRYAFAARYCDAKRVLEADLSHPVILSADGSLFDGSHRIAKAWVLGHETIQVVRFRENPEPDEIVPVEPSS